MNKKKQNIELKIYELLGIKTFRKMAFGLYKTLGFPFTIFMSKERRKEFFDSPNNYNMKKGHGIQDLRDFKKWLLFNACIHVWGLYKCIPTLFNLISSSAPLALTITTLICTAINCYCIMLQRYNQIRINQAIKKTEPHEEAKKNKLKEELIKEDSLLSEHTYKVVNKRYKEKSITFEEVLKKATYNQLEIYRNYLSYYKHIEKMMKEDPDFYSDEQPSVSVRFPLPKNKELKLEFKTTNMIKENKNK